MGIRPTPNLTLIDCRCEALVNPLGIDAIPPALSWKLTSPRRDQRHSAYRIVVASSVERLAGNEGKLSVKRTI